MRRRYAFLAAAALAACVPIEDAPMTKNAVLPGQRTVLLVFVPNGPIVDEEDSKAESAAKIVPGLGLVMKNVQDERDANNAAELKQYLPSWRPVDLFYPALRRALIQSGHPGRILSAADADILAPTIRKLDPPAPNPVEWRGHYYYETPGAPAPRDYSALLNLDDALIFEANLLYGVNSDGEGNATPKLGLVAKLYRASTMKQLWRHEEVVLDPKGPKDYFTYKTHPNDLIKCWTDLMPALAFQVASAFQKNLVAAGVALVAPSLSTGTVSGLSPFAAPTSSATATFAPVAASSSTAVASAPTTSSSTVASTQSSTMTTSAPPSQSSATASSPAPISNVISTSTSAANH